MDDLVIAAFQSLCMHIALPWTPQGSEARLRRWSRGLGHVRNATRNRSSWFIFQYAMWKLGFTITNIAFSSFTTPCAGGWFSGMGFCVRYTRLSLMLEIWTSIPLGNARTTSTRNFKKLYTLQRNGVLTNSERSVSESCRLFCCFANACAPRVTSCDRSGLTVFPKHARHSCLRVTTSYLPCISGVPD